MNEPSAKAYANFDTSPLEKETEGQSWLEKIGHALIGDIDSTERILDLLKGAVEQNVIGSDEYAMIEGVMKVGETQVREIMIPRSQMTVLKIDDPIDHILKIIIESSHSRFPVIGDSKDDIEGILLAKDILAYTLSGELEDLQISDVLRPAVIIPESKRLNVLLKDFKEFRNHIAIIVDEYGGVSGLVTIEDVLEEIVGDIEDEHDFEQEVNIQPLEEGRFMVDALTTLEEFNEHFSASFDSDEVETIGGIVLNAFGHMPKRNEQISIDDFSFKVKKSDHRRIHQLLVNSIGAF